MGQGQSSSIAVYVIFSARSIH